MSFENPRVFFLLLAILIAVSLWIVFWRRKILKEEQNDQGIWMVALLAILLCYFIVDILRQTFPGDSYPPRIELGDKTQNVPNYLVFFATAVSAYLLYKTLNSQRRANQVAAFENKFFKFIDYHRENVNLLKTRDAKSPGKDYWEGNQVFTVIYYELRDLLGEYFKKVNLSDISLEEKREGINFVYQCVFYGAGSDGVDTLKRKFSKWDSFFQRINFVNKRAAYSKILKPQVYYSGHIRHLGQYFRNLYQAVQYVDRQTFLDAHEKYEYVKTLRSQMSLHEQLVFFFSSLSELGKNWEWEQYEREIPGKKDRRKVFEKLLVTKYDLIRNFLNSDGVLIKGLSLLEFYPLLTLEGAEECGRYGVLPFKGNDSKICRYCFNRKYVKYENVDEKQKISAYFERPDINREAFVCDEAGCRTKKFIATLKPSA